MKLEHIIKIAWIILSVPLSLISLLLVNLANLVAPEFTFNFIKKNMKVNGLDFSKFKSTKDIAFFFSFDRVLEILRIRIRDVLKQAQFGNDAPNPFLIDPINKTKTSLLSYAKAGRPLVLNFGSCT